jgi:hypothetical protein
MVLAGPRQPTGMTIMHSWRPTDYASLAVIKKYLSSDPLAAHQRHASNILLLIAYGRPASYMFTGELPTMFIIFIRNICLLTYFIILVKKTWPQNTALSLKNLKINKKDPILMHAFF